MEQNNLYDKKIAVAGIGGVGGYLAGMLAKTYPHVTLAARGERLNSLREKGLILHSGYNGEIMAKPETVTTLENMDVQDYIFICVKNYSLEEVCRSLKGAVADHTVLIPVMNGVDPGSRVRDMLQKGTVIDALIYIIAFANPDYSVTQQGDFARLKIGLKDADEDSWKKVEEVSAILSGAGIDHEATAEIEQEIWRKYILNCAYNVGTAYYEEPIGKLRSDPAKAKKYEELVNEAYQVSQAKNIGIRQEHIDAIIYRFYHEYADDATSSLQRDVCMRKKSELETFSGYLVREARRLGVPAPVSEEMYEGLKQKESWRLREQQV